MSKRLLVVALSAIGMLGIQGAAMAHESSESERRDWACIAIHDLEQGVCQRNPLPDRLPIPDESTTPEVPEVTAPEATAPEAPTVAVPDTSGVSAPTAPSTPTL